MPHEKQFNWWMVAFFVLLVAFEFVREFAVSQVYAPPKIAVSTRFWVAGSVVHASGRWTRIDRGDPLAPGAIVIECSRDDQKCREISYNFLDDYAGTPTLDTFDAKFTDEAVTYSNDVPNCLTYSVRMDLNLRQVFATRQKKENVTDELCGKLERRIEMTLGDSYVPYWPYHDHYLPLLWLAVHILP